MITIRLKGPSEPVGESGSNESDKAAKELEAVTNKLNEEPKIVEVPEPTPKKKLIIKSPVKQKQYQYPLLLKPTDKYDKERSPNTKSPKVREKLTIKAVKTGKDTSPSQSQTKSPRSAPKIHIKGHKKSLSTNQLPIQLVNHNKTA